jgi:molybdopterin-guanine dinucleotide biosynthesis protein
MEGSLMGELGGEMEALQQGLSQFRAPGAHKPATGISEEPSMEMFDPLKEKKKKKGKKKKKKKVGQAANEQTETDEHNRKKRMKVTLLSGFLGAGKTTILKRILRLNNERSDAEKLKIAVIVNDMGEINLDADEIKNSKLIQEDAEMVEMHNGCICCTLRGDLLQTVKSLSQEEKFDYLVIESTGISEPLPVAQTFVMDVDAQEQPTTADGVKEKLTVSTAEKNSLSHYATLDTLVTVVEALNIFDVLGSIEVRKPSITCTTSSL